MITSTATRPPLSPAIRIAAASLLALSAGTIAPAARAADPPNAPGSTAPAALPDPKIKGKQCKGANGVTVVVDFRDLHNPGGRRMNLVKIGCARGAQDDGLDAIVNAGFRLGQRGGLVCRIDERPLPEQTDCASEGYWSYWHGERGGPWDYSGVGAGGWVPPPGGLEGWAWNWYDQAEADPRVEPSDLYPPAPSH